MSIQAKQDSYIVITTELNRAGSKVGVVIAGECTTIDDDGSFLIAPSTYEKKKETSGMVIHSDALDVLNQLPLTEKLLEQSKGQKALWLLQPKGPATSVEKKFEEFLKALAAHRGCDVDSLKKQGFICRPKGKNSPKISFPNKDMASLFQQMLNDNLSASQLFENHSVNDNKHTENSTRLSM